MSGRGRPLRFLVLVLSVWTGARVAQLWPERIIIPDALKALSPLPLPAHAARPIFRQVAGLPRPIPARIMPAAASATPTRRAGVGAPRSLAATAAPAQQASIVGAAVALPLRALSTPAQPERLAPLPDRWSASAWVVARPGMGLGAAPGGGQLGGSQAGIRVAWLLSPSRRVTAFGRLTTPLRGRGAEAAVGLEWQPSRMPVRLVVERRLGLDGVTGGFGAGVVGGSYGEIAPGFRLESYGQAGVVRRDRTEPYADGAARVTRQLALLGPVALSAGAGIWGAAQRDAARLDVGPSVTLGVPLAGRSVRMSLDWRQRVAGDARPGSGLALTLGSDL